MPVPAPLALSRCLDQGQKAGRAWQQTRMQLCHGIVVGTFYAGQNNKWPGWGILGRSLCEQIPIFECYDPQIYSITKNVLIIGTIVNLNHTTSPYQFEGVNQKF